MDYVSNTALKFTRGGSAIGGSREELEKKGLLELGATYNTLGDMAQVAERAFL
jgi:hypothetical protein